MNIWMDCLDSNPHIIKALEKKTNMFISKVVWFKKSEIICGALTSQSIVEMFGGSAYSINYTMKDLELNQYGEDMITFYFDGKEK